MQPSLSEFRKYYNVAIYPELVRLDYERKRLLRYMGLSVVLVVLAVLFATMARAWLVAFLLVLPVLGYVSWLGYQYRLYRQKFKPHVVGLILDFLDEDPNIGLLRYQADRAIDEQTFCASRLFVARRSEYDSYEGEDFISGTLGSLEFEVSELRVLVRSRVRHTFQTVFRGVFCHARTSFPTSGQLYLLPRHREQFLTRTLHNLAVGGLKEVSHELNDEAFVEEFMVYADRTVRLHKLMLPHLRRELVAYIEETGKEIYLAFHNQQVYIAVSQDKDLLEPPLWFSVVRFELVREFFEDVRMLLRLIEMLDEVV